MIRDFTYRVRENKRLKMKSTIYQYPAASFIKKFKRYALYYVKRHGE